MSAESKIPQDEVWHVGMRSGHNANIIYRYDGAHKYDDTAICQVYGIPINQDVTRCADSDGMPYAQLIASAPTLAAELAKLRDALKSIKTVARQGGALLPVRIEQIVDEALAKGRAG